MTSPRPDNPSAGSRSPAQRAPRPGRIEYLPLCLLCLLLGTPHPARADILHSGQSAGQRFVVETVVGGLGIPWGMAFLAPHQLLITEREGRASLLDLSNMKLTALDGVPAVLSAGQGGLLDVAVPPGYRAGDWIYFTYSKEQRGQGVTTLARARLQGARLVPWNDLLVTHAASATSQHYGSRITFDGQGHVFFTVGERGVRENAQDLGNHAGKVLRLNLDGSVPADNPFAGRADARPEIWSYGHRNPQGIAYDHQRRRLWVIEHGPRGGDELNLVLPGRNYGWPVISYGMEYWGPVAVGEGTHKAGMQQPVKYYVPSIAPGSLLLYTGDAFPAWRDNLFAGALVLQHLNRIVLDAQGGAVGEERLLTALNQRLRALAQSPQGWLYVATDGGSLLRIRPAP